jgi:hypothetical protein
MTQPGMLWRHVVINTHCTWLHGDDRGFRSRHHRVHSSGDYRNPPSSGQSFCWHFSRPECSPFGVAVGKVHKHAVVELPKDLRRVKRIIGEAKRYASRAVTISLPGAIWSANGEFVPILRADHLKAAYEYDLYKQGPGAWTWPWRDRSRKGIFGRKRPRPSR